MLVPFLASCSKTSELYADYAYNSPDFMENYYRETNGIEDLEIESNPKEYSLINKVNYHSESSLKHVRDYDNPNKLPWVDSLNYDNEYGRNYNLSKTNQSFSYGYLSKLYDGRVRCEGKYQLSRVQLDKHGYATFFPKQLVDYSYLGISLRGATDFDNSGPVDSPYQGEVVIDLHVSFYIANPNSEKYKKVTFNFIDAAIPCDNSGSTYLITLYLTNENAIDGETHRSYRYDLFDATAMSMSYELKTFKAGYDVSDDADEEKDHHFAVMLYEVLMPNSSWQ